MGLFKRSTQKPARKDPADREKSRGAREYNARVHDRNADRLERAGDEEGAAAARDAAEAERQPPRKRKH